MTNEDVNVEAMQIQIAQDVIKLLRVNTRNLQVWPGTYVEAMYGDLVRQEHVETNVELGPLLKNCKVCALGAMFVAEIDRNNHFGCSDLHETSSLPCNPIEDRLLNYFNSGQLADIESAFEGWHVTPFSHYLDPTERLIAIMENIIRNGGDFNEEEQKHFMSKQDNGTSDLPPGQPSDQDSLPSSGEEE